MTRSQRARLRVKATAYRDQWLEEELRGIGFIFFWNGKAVAWGRELGDPGNWEPGVLALGQNSALHRSVGGNGDRGALRWEAVA